MHDAWVSMGDETLAKMVRAMKVRRDLRCKVPMERHLYQVEEKACSGRKQKHDSTFRQSATNERADSSTYRGDCPTPLPPNRSSMIRPRESSSASGDRFSNGKVNDFPSLRIRDSGCGSGMSTHWVSKRTALESVVVVEDDGWMVVVTDMAAA